MKNLRFLLPVAIVALFIIVGCSDNQEDYSPVIDNSETIDSYKFSGDQEDSIRDPFGN